MVRKAPDSPHPRSFPPRIRVSGDARVRAARPQQACGSAWAGVAQAVPSTSCPGPLQLPAHPLDPNSLPGERASSSICRWELPLQGSAPVSVGAPAALQSEGDAGGHSAVCGSGRWQALSGHASALKWPARSHQLHLPAKAAAVRARVRGPGATPVSSAPALGQLPASHSGGDFSQEGWRLVQVGTPRSPAHLDCTSQRPHQHTGPSSAPSPSPLLSGSSGANSRPRG